MSTVLNPVAVLWRVMRVWFEGLQALARLIGVVLGAVTGPGSFRTRLTTKLLAPATQLHVMAVLRAFKPNLSLSTRLVKAYDNTGTAVVTRRRDVLEVLTRDADFEVVYEPRMRELTDGDNFFLGMQPGWDYERDVSAMRLAARRTDAADVVLPRAAALAERLVSASGGDLDLPPALTLQVPWDITATYFGTPGPDAATMQGWTTRLFWYLFGDLGADADLKVGAMADAAALRDYLDTTIASRKAAASDDDDLLGRCLALQRANVPGMSDLGIRNNLLGLLIGAIPTISKASCLALDELFRRPDAMAGAQAAARADDDATLAAHIWEALRFNPHNPVIYRRATRDTTVAESTMRTLRIAKGQLVFAANFSAMFDRLEVPEPQAFRTDRPWDTYIHWGLGMHRCFGDAINRVVIPAILKPLLSQRGLRAVGALDTGGTPFPQHFKVAFDPT
ncbi:MAG: cytochrome P450 [Pseudomonadota bacterium]